MIAWLLYSLLVSLIVLAGAYAADRVLRLQGRATRGIWVVSLVGSLLLPALWPWLPRALDATAPAALLPGTFTIGLDVSAATEAARIWSLPRLLLLVWFFVSAMLLLYGLCALWRLRVWRARWRTGVLAGESVLYSQNVGPAVVGLLKPAVVVPAWIMGLTDEEQRMILAHECAHIAARDPWLVALSQLLPALFPWNLPLWWQARRLRDAVELDCDGRVLARHGRQRYAELLLSVGGRAAGLPLALASLSEPPSLLEKRIRRIVETRPRQRALRSGLWAVAACVAILCAFRAPLPVARVPAAAPNMYETRPVPARSVELPAQVTPDTVRAVAARRQPSRLNATMSGAERRALEEAVLKRAGAAEAAMAQRRARLSAEQQLADTSGGPGFIPYQVTPQLRNLDDVRAAVVQHYPPLLRDAGIGGTVNLWFLIDEQGTVQRVLLRESSGHQALDQAALRVAALIRFTPARNHDREVATWVNLPISFRAPQRPAGNEDALAQPSQRATRRPARLNQDGTS